MDLEYTNLQYKNIKGYEHYKLYENGKVYNTKTNNILSWVEYSDGFAINLTKDNKSKSFRLARLMYMHYCDDELTNEDIVQFVDGNKRNFNYTNLKKIKKIDMLKQNNVKHTEKAIEKKNKIKLEKEEQNKPIELDKSKEWRFMKDNDEYKISNYGDVYSIKSNKILKPNLCHIGYYRVKLNIKKEKIHLLLHRLVYDTFKGIKDQNKVIDHIDTNKLNNHIDNLREVTKSVNAQNCIKKLKTTKINQYTIDGKFIKLWNSIKEIKESNFNIQLIKQNCKNIIDNAHNYRWTYVEEPIILNDISEFVPIKTDDENINFNYKINKAGNIINKENKVLKSSLSCEYNTINLSSNNGQSKFFKINRLVAITFIPNPNNYPVVNHIDEDKLNDNVENLEWCSYAQNSAHSQGKKINQLDLKTNEIIKTFNSISDAQRSLGVKCRMNISEVCRGKRIKAYGYKWGYA